MNDTEIIGLIQAALTSVAPNRSADWAKVELSSSIESLALDSIATMEMVGFLEDKTESTFPDEDLAKVNKLADLATLIRTGRL